ncbi:MAG: Bug family tripartite tricarboxylate transporter substrate binding protein [Paracoccus sp. (in: a-proteobacteria)]
MKHALVELSRKAPQELTYGTAGVGSSAHLAGELLQKHLEINLLHVPYKGAGAASQGLLAGTVDVMISGLPAANNLLNDENIRLFAIIAGERAPQRSDTPTVNEDSPRFDLTVWLGLAAPSSTAPDIVQRLAERMKEAVEMPEVKQKLLDLGVSPKFEAGDEVLLKARKELKDFNQAIDAAGIERR